MIHNDLHLQKHMKVRHGVRDKMLWVGDSISSNMDFKHIEENISMDIKHAKAYTVTSEAVGAIQYILDVTIYYNVCATTSYIQLLLAKWISYYSGATYE